MRRLTRCIPVSTDGFIATGDDELGDWFTWDEEMQAFVNGILRSIDTIVCGRVCFETIVPYWDAIADGDPSAEAVVTDGDREFAATMQGVDRVVLSRTLRDAGRRSTIIADDAVGELARLKRAPGSDILLHCGLGLLAELTGHGLIDE